MAKRKEKEVDRSTLLARAIVAGLEERRQSTGPSSVPFREAAHQAARLAGLEVTDADLATALTKAPLKSRIVLAFANDLDARCVLKEDLVVLAGDERLLRGTCERVCSPQAPLAGLDPLAKQLASPALRKAFLQHWESRIEAGTVPDFVEVYSNPSSSSRKTSTSKTPTRTTSTRTPKSKSAKRLLRDVRFPLPWESTSRELVERLRLRSASGHVVVELRDLAESVPGAESLAHLEMAFSTEPYRSSVIPVFTKPPHEQLVTLAENAARSVSDPRVFDTIHRGLLKKGDNATDLATLKKQKLLDPRLAAPFAALLDQIPAATPEGFGAIRVGKKVYLFQFADLPESQRAALTRAEPRVAPSPSPKPTLASAEARKQEFTREFNAAFNRLDASGGGFNFVKLLALREALPQFPRDEFDANLRELRLARRFTLSGSEGHSVRLTPQELSAGFIESGGRLVYCSRTSN